MDEAIWKRIEKFSAGAKKIGPGNNASAKKLLQELVSLLSDVQMLR